MSTELFHSSGCCAVACRVMLHRLAIREQGLSGGPATKALIRRRLHFSGVETAAGSVLLFCSPFQLSDVSLFRVGVVRNPDC
jgi:hypothetical protein